MRSTGSHLRRGTQADIAIDARRPEMIILAFVDPVELQSSACRVDLQIEYAGLHRLLILTGQAVEGRGESVGDMQVHQNGVSISVGPIGIKFLARLFLLFRPRSELILIGSSNLRRLLTT